MAVYAERVKDTTIDTGTGTVTLSGTAPTGFRTFSSVFTVDTDYFPYMLLDGNGIGWERGYAKLDTIGTELARSFVIESTNSNSTISLSGTTPHTIFVPVDIDQNIFRGYTLGLNASHPFINATETLIEWDIAYDDPQTFITSQLPITQLTVPAWVSMVEVTVQLIYPVDAENPTIYDFITRIRDSTGTADIIPQSYGRTCPSNTYNHENYPHRQFNPHDNGGTFAIAVQYVAGTVDGNINVGSTCQVRFIE